MGERTAIAWCDHSWNPWWGCTKIEGPAGSGSGCDHCYAAAFANRLGKDLWGTDAPRRFFGDAHWAKPLAWDRKAAAVGERHRVFCASMADVFEDRRDLDPQRDRLWQLVDATPNLDWLLLTKRPEHVRHLVPDRWLASYEVVNMAGALVQTIHGWPRNVWLGVTVEDERRARVRLPRLAAIPAAVRFVSYEPALGDVDFSPWLPELDWIIAGGESGAGHRPPSEDWFRRVRDDCKAEGVAFFMKQMGTGWAKDDPRGDRNGTVIDTFPSELRVREFPTP